jgi:hypothetical protein
LAAVAACAAAFAAAAALAAASAEAAEAALAEAEAAAAAAALALAAAFAAALAAPAALAAALAFACAWATDMPAAPLKPCVLPQALSASIRIRPRDRTTFFDIVFSSLHLVIMLSSRRMWSIPLRDRASLQT